MNDLVFMKPKSQFLQGTATYMIRLSQFFYEQLRADASIRLPLCDVN